MQIIRDKAKENNSSSSQSNDLELEFYVFSKDLYDYTLFMNLYFCNVWNFPLKVFFND